MGFLGHTLCRGHANKLSLMPILGTSASLRDITQAKPVHARFIDLDQGSDLAVGTALLHAYGRCGILGHARCLFDRMPEKTTHVWNVMVSAYAHSGHLSIARTLFKAMPERNVSSWNTIISAYAQYGHGITAFELFWRMPFSPNSVTFVSTLSACDDHMHARMVHSRVVDCALNLDVVVGTALVHVYGRFQRVSNACRIFEMLAWRDRICWNAMLSVLASNGEAAETMALFARFEMTKMKPNHVTFVSVLDACITLEQGKATHARISSIFHNLGIILSNSLITMYGKFRCLVNAVATFDQIVKHDIISWTAIITAFAEYGYSEQVLKLLQRMHSDNLMPNQITLISGLNSCTHPLALKNGKTIHSCIARFGFSSDVSLGNALINMYGKCGGLEDGKRVFANMLRRDVVSWNSMIAAYGNNNGLKFAKELFERCPERNVISWTTLITVYARNGHSKRALELFYRMESEDLKPNKISFVSLLVACTSCGDLEEGKRLHVRIVRFGYELDATITNALITMYGKLKCIEDARGIYNKMCIPDFVSRNAMITAYMQNGYVNDATSVFDRMPQWNVVSWNAMIAGYAQCGKAKEALGIYELMGRKGIKPDMITFVSALEACAITATLTEGKLIHASSASCGLNLNIVVSNALVTMYGKCGILEDACRMFANISSQQDIISWNSIIAAHAENGDAFGALELLTQMELEGVVANNITFMSVLSACSHANLLVEGRSCFCSMYTCYGITPMAEHYVCMIGLFGNAGRLDDAEDFINSMSFEPPFGPHALAYMRLLSACKIHNDMERGARAMELLLESRTQNS